MPAMETRKCLGLSRDRFVADPCWGEVPKRHRDNGLHDRVERGFYGQSRIRTEIGIFRE